MDSSSKICALVIFLSFSFSSALESECGSCSRPRPHPKAPITVPVPVPPPSRPWCPIDTLKLGACVELLGGLMAANECCPLMAGLVEIEAAVCLCTALKIKALNLNLYIPLALQLLVTCGKTPPPGYTCSLSN